MVNIERQEEDNMEDGVLKVNINSLKDVSGEIEKHNQTILDNLKGIQTDFSSLDECFDSKTAREYKEVMNKCLTKTNDYVSTRNEYLVNKLNEINELYWELYDEVKTSVTGDKMEKENG